MDRENFELVKTLTIILKINEESSDIVLSGDDSGNMYFKFCLEYITCKAVSRTSLYVVDDFHAGISVGLKPNATVTFTSPLELGTYKGKILYIDLYITPYKFENEEYSVKINFLTKERN